MFHDAIKIKIPTSEIKIKIVDHDFNEGRFATSIANKMLVTFYEGYRYYLFNCGWGTVVKSWDCPCRFTNTEANLVKKDYEDCENISLNRREEND